MDSNGYGCMLVLCVVIVLVCVLAFRRTDRRPSIGTGGIPETRHAVQLDSRQQRLMTAAEREALQGRENGVISEDHEVVEQAPDSSHAIRVVRTHVREFTNGVLVNETDDYRTPDLYAGMYDGVPDYQPGQNDRGPDWLRQ